MVVVVMVGAVKEGTFAVAVAEVEGILAVVAATEVRATAMDLNVYRISVCPVLPLLFG